MVDELMERLNALKESESENRREIRELKDTIAELRAEQELARRQEDPEYKLYRVYYDKEDYIWAKDEEKAREEIADGWSEYPDELRADIVDSTPSSYSEMWMYTEYIF